MENRMTLKEFNQNFKLIKNYLKETRKWDGYFFGTNGDEITYVRSKSKNSQVLTILQNEIVTGMRRDGTEIGFLVLDKPYESDFTVSI
jgi:hypothetical protein